jgi:hypothetical protein
LAAGVVAMPRLFKLAPALASTFHGNIKRHAARVDHAEVRKHRCYADTSRKAEVGSTLEWGTPVLYIRSPVERISDISGLASSVEPLQPSIGA